MRVKNFKIIFQYNCGKLPKLAKCFSPFNCRVRYSFVNIDFYSECKGKPVAEVRFIPVKDDLETLEEALYRADESGVTGENPPTKLVKLS